MTRFVGADEAARQLGVQKATLYAYVSRGLIQRRVAVDGRTSLYSAADLDALLRRARRRDVEPRPSIDVQIVTRITVLDEAGVRYRGHDVAALARTCHFEQVAELLWTGTLPDHVVVWPSPEPDDRALARRVTRAVRAPALPALVAVTSALGARHPDDDPPTAARRLLGVVPTVLGEPDGAPDGSMAERLARCWQPQTADALAGVVDRALVLLADHELATSTLAVRVAGSTWTPPYQAFVAGLAVIQGPLHGAATRLVHELLVDCEQHGAEAVVAQRLRAGERLPGFGHKIYKGDDPRLTPLLEAIATLPDPRGRLDVVDDLMREAGVRLTRRPNIDLGLGVLAFVAGLPADVPIFAVARLAGFAAHLVEELAERPLRYRGLARPGWRGAGDGSFVPDPGATCREPRSGVRCTRGVDDDAGDDAMGMRSARTGAVALLVLVAAGCSTDHSSSGPTSSASASSAPSSLVPASSVAPASSVSPASSAPASSGAPCATPDVAATTGCWRQVLPLGSGGFPASPGSQDQPLWQPGRFPLTLTPRLAFHDELWMTAQTLTYSSPDGLTWTQHDKTDWGERIYQAITYFKGKLWLFGGLDYQARTFLNDVWSSSDGITWTKEGTAAWTPRGAQTVVVHHDQLWLFGGADHVAQDRSTDQFLNDVWVSDDGLTWTQVTDAAAWSPRDYPGVIVFDDQLYVVGGQGHTDVWRTSDGKDWTPLVAQAPWGPRHGAAQVVFDGKLWVFGGFIGTSTNALNDVWYSDDGITWTQQALHAPWGPRLPVAIVFQDKIWIYSGKHTGGTDNWGGDLWQMTTAAEA